FQNTKLRWSHAAWLTRLFPRTGRHVRLIIPSQARNVTVNRGDPHERRRHRHSTTDETKRIHATPAAHQPVGGLANIRPWEAPHARTNGSAGDHSEKRLQSSASAIARDLKVMN